MKLFFEGILTIPAGRKAGKYLQKIATVKDLPSLAASVEFCIVELTTMQEWDAALLACTSCQSREPSIRDQFYKVWSRIDGVKFLAMINPEGDIVARCLVNPSWGTHAPTYGAGHFMLNARLEFAGFEPGPVALTRAVEAVLTVEEAPVSIGMPQSRVFYDRWSYRLPSDQEIKEAKWVLQCLTSKPLLDEARNTLASKRSYNRAYRKYAPKVPYGEAFVLHHRAMEPITDRYEYREETVYRDRSSLYLDSERRFLDKVTVYRAGWYTKNKK